MTTTTVSACVDASHDQKHMKNNRSCAQCHSAIGCHRPIQRQACSRLGACQRNNPAERRECWECWECCDSKTCLERGPLIENVSCPEKVITSSAWDRLRRMFKCVFRPSTRWDGGIGLASHGSVEPLINLITSRVTLKPWGRTRLQCATEFGKRRGSHLLVNMQPLQKDTEKYWKSIRTYQNQ